MVYRQHTGEWISVCYAESASTADGSLNSKCQSDPSTPLFSMNCGYTHKRRSPVVRHGLLCVDKPDTCPFDLEEDKLRFWLGRWNGCHGGQGCLLGLALFPCGLFEEPTYTGFKLATSSRWLGLSPLRCSFTLH